MALGGCRFAMNYHNGRQSNQNKRKDDAKGSNVSFKMKQIEI